MGLLQFDSRMRCAGAFTLLAAALGAAPAADAQTTAGDDRPAQRVSPTGLPGGGLRIEASLRTLFDSNILRIGEGVSLRPGASKSDFRISPLVTLGYGLGVGRQQVYVNADIGRDFFARNSQLNRNRYSLGGGALLKVGRSCSGSISAQYDRRQSLTSDASIRTDNTQELQEYYIGADCAPPAGIGFGGSVGRSVTDNVGGLRQAQDAREMNYDAHLNFGARALGSFSLGGGYSHFDYPRRSLFVPLSGGGIDTVGDQLDLFRGQVGYSRRVGTRINISASGSYIKVMPVPRNVLNLIQVPGGVIPLVNARPTYGGPGFTLSVSYQPSVRLGATLAASRNVSAATNVGARFDVRDNISGTLSYKVGPSIQTTLGGSWDHRQFRGGFATVEEPVARVGDTISRVFARAAYAPGRLYSVDFELAHQWRNSNPSIYNFASTSAALSLRLKFGRG